MDLESNIEMVLAYSQTKQFNIMLSERCDINLAILQTKNNLKKFNYFYYKSCYLS